MPPPLKKRVSKIFTGVTIFVIGLYAIRDKSRIDRQTIK